MFQFSRIFVLRLNLEAKVPAADRRALQLILAGPSGISHRAPSSAWSVTPLKIDRSAVRISLRVCLCAVRLLSARRITLDFPIPAPRGQDAIIENEQKTPQRR